MCDWPIYSPFDHTFTLNDIRTCDVELQIQGTDNFVLNGVSSMSQISRDPEDLIQQTLNENHQYPDGFVLFLGTLFAPTQDREQLGLALPIKLEMSSVSIRLNLVLCTTRL